MASVNTLQHLYVKNKTVATKIQFQEARDYKLIAMKYGIAIINNSFETLYVAIIPANEDAPVEKPIFAIPVGQRVNIPTTEGSLRHNFPKHLKRLLAITRSHM